jgi:hypothetical protein
MTLVLTKKNNVCVATVTNADGTGAMCSFPLLLLDNTVRRFDTFIQHVEAGTDAEYGYLDDEYELETHIVFTCGNLTFAFTHDARNRTDTEPYTSNFTVRLNEQVLTELKKLRGMFSTCSDEDDEDGEGEDEGEHEDNEDA